MQNTKLATKSEVLKYMRSKKFAIDVLRNIENYSHHNFVSIASMNDKVVTLRDWAEEIEEEKRQQTTAVSVRFAYDFEAAVFLALKAAGFTVLSKDKANSTARCDVRVATSDFGIVPFEIKTTQGADGWTGATHSEEAGKVESYILIKYVLDMDKEIPVNGGNFQGVLKECHFSVIEMGVSWNGKATTSNSSTTGKIPAEKADEYNQGVIFGKAVGKVKWCKILTENLMNHRDASGTLVSGDESQPAQLPLMARAHNFSETTGVRA